MGFTAVVVCGSPAWLCFVGLPKDNVDVSGALLCIGALPRRGLQV